MFETAPEVALFYPPPALDIVLAVLFGLRYLPVLLLPRLIDVWLIPPINLPPLIGFVYALLSAIVYGGAIVVLVRVMQIEPNLRRFRDMVRFLAVATLAAPLTLAVLATSVFAALDVIPWSDWQIRVLHLWVGDSIGMASLAPFLLICAAPWLTALVREGGQLRLPQLSSGVILEYVAEAIALILGIWIAFGLDFAEQFQLLYVCFLPMIWLTVRYGLWAATLSVLVINTGAALLTLPAPSPLLGLELATVQFCLLAVSQTALLLGATISRRFQAYVQIQSLARRERLLNQISRSLNSTLDPNQVLQDIVQCTGQYFRVDRVVLWRLGTNEVIAVSEWRLNLQVPTMLGTHSSLADWFGQRDTDDDLWQHEPFQAQDYAAFQHPPARAALIEQSQLRSILRVPIFIRNQFFGSLSLHTTVTYRIFTSEEVSSLEQIAEQVAIALYNAQSYEQLERLVQERTQELEDERLVSESANRAKTEFLANMSHELRTPLTSILGFSSVLLQQVFGPLNQRQQEYLTTVHSSGEHLLELINDVLDLARIEAGKEDLTIELVSVEDLCRACMSLIEAQIEAQSRPQGLDLNLDIAPDATICHADLRRLRQILVNLLSNAVKFTEAGSVTLRVSRTGDGLDFAVTDTGIGIAAADQTRLFQPFQQLDSGLNRRYQGSGLGLALAQRLARLHEGEITLQSELGRGSCFTLHLPDIPPPLGDLRLN